MKTVLITGTSTGIGKVTAKLFASKGWQVAATMRTPEKEKELTNVKNIKLYSLDVTQDERNIFDTIKQITSDLQSIDVLINNAGIGVFGAFEATDFESIKKQFDTNVFGLMRVTRGMLPYFRDRGSGLIINITSGVGRIGLPVQSLYNSTKFAIEGFSESLHYELRPLGIRVKIVEPGNIKTDFFNSLIVAENQNISAYRAYQQKVMANHFKLDERGSKPKLVANVIYKAANDPSDRLRYPAGNDVTFFLMLRKLLPDSLFFRLVRSQLEG
jgi:short-subunit dehydrogenase